MGAGMGTPLVYDVPMRLLLTSLILIVPMLAQDAPQNKERRAPRPPQNLKVLKATTGPEVMQSMRTFTAGLGVKCDYCHVEGNMASDDNNKKIVARQMIEMVDKINASFSDGKAHVSCYTCHRGEAEPKMAPEPKPAQ